MTGGQASATTPVGAITTTTTKGSEVPPIHLAEIVAMFERPAFVARCSVHTPKYVLEFKKAFRKAMEYQINDKAYCFIEVLGVCVTASKVDPISIARYTEEKLLPIFPLGVLKDAWKHL